jgi:hypothetical protein
MCIYVIKIIEYQITTDDNTDVIAKNEFFKR